MLRDNNNYYSYLCLKCKHFPYIIFENQNEIIYQCGCTRKEGNLIKIKEYLNEISKNDKNLDDKNIDSINRCKRHNRKFRYYCSNCHINLCRECCGSHWEKRHDLKIFDFNDYYIRRRVNEIILSVNSKRKCNHRIKIENDFENSHNFEELMENISNYSEESKEDNDIKLYKININNNDNHNARIEENNPYYLIKLIKIIINDYLKYPNFMHFYNIENAYRFLLNKENKNILSSGTCYINELEKKDVMTIIYKNENKKIRLFGSEFIKKNIDKVYMKIGKNISRLKEYYKFDAHKEEVKLELIVLEKEIDMSYMFNNCVNLKSLIGISDWKTKIKNMNYMFYNCPSLDSLPDISEWNVSTLNKIKFMFYNCCSLVKLPDLSKWFEKNYNLFTNNNPFLSFSFSQLFPGLKNINKKNIKLVKDEKGDTELIKISKGTEKILNIKEK